MTPTEERYFNRRINYKTRGTNNIADEKIKEYIFESMNKIRNTAQDALSGAIPSRKARVEISDLLDNIKELKRGIKNVTLG
jgi:hypothetical protein